MVLTTLTKTSLSPAGTMRGYSFKTWLKGTKESFKTLLTAGLAVGAYFVTKSTMTPELVAVVMAVVAAFSKWAMDGLDFWLSDVTV